MLNHISNAFGLAATFAGGMAFHRCTQADTNGTIRWLTVVVVFAAVPSIISLARYMGAKTDQIIAEIRPGDAEEDGQA